MNDFEGLGLNDLGRPAQNASEAHTHAVGAPLPMGAGGRAAGQEKAPSSRAVPPPGRALTSSSEASDPMASGMQWALGALRRAFPFVQKILPLLEGNVASSVASLMVPQSAPEVAPVSLAPIEEGLAELQTQQRELRDQVIEQNTSLKRVEDQLEMVREATDRNTLEQQELLEDLKSVGNKVNTVAVVALGLLVISVVLNILLLLHLQRVLP